MAIRWAKNSPKNFKFTAKLPKAITHDKRLKDIDNELDYFFEAMLPLSKKTIVILMQLQLSLQIKEDLEQLRVSSSNR
jgi:uncharacterized protein YecE (DUF72 family)